LKESISLYHIIGSYPEAPCIQKTRFPPQVEDKPQTLATPGFFFEAPLKNSKCEWCYFTMIEVLDHLINVANMKMGRYMCEKF